MNRLYPGQGYAENSVFRSAGLGGRQVVDNTNHVNLMMEYAGNAQFTGVFCGGKFECVRLSVLLFNPIHWS